MTCYSATHNNSGKQYIGITSRNLQTRRAEHESHSAEGSPTEFHSALQKYGKENFTWKVEAKGDKKVIQLLERVLIGEWRTLVPRGFNSTNEASDFELPPTNDELRMFEELDMNVAEMEMVYDLLNILRDSVKNRRFTQKTKDLIKPLIRHLEDGNCLEDC